MFRANRWAAAFVGLAGNDPEALSCLKALIPPVKAIPGALFGHASSRRLALLLQESAEAAGFAGQSAAYAIRFIALLVEKNLFGHIDSIMARVEELFDQQAGVLDVTAESASPMDDAFQDELRRKIADLGGAAKVNLKIKLVPELLGGYRLRFRGFYVDASVKGQMEKMKASLEAAALVPGV